MNGEVARERPSKLTFHSFDYNEGLRRGGRIVNYLRPAIIGLLALAALLAGGSAPAYDSAEITALLAANR